MRIVWVVSMVCMIIIRLAFKKESWSPYVAITIVVTATILYLCAATYIRVKLRLNAKHIEKQAIVEYLEVYQKKKKAEADNRRARVLAIKKAKGKIDKYKIETLDIDTLLRGFNKITLDSGIFYHSFQHDITTAFYVPFCAVNSFNPQTETDKLQAFDDELLEHLSEKHPNEHEKITMECLACIVLYKHENISLQAEDFYYAFTGYVSPQSDREYNYCGINTFTKQVCFYQALYSDNEDEANLSHVIIENLSLAKE